MRLAVIAFCLGLLLAPLHAEAPVKALEAVASEVPVLNGAFEQQKSIKGFKRLLKSRGRFSLVQGKGVLWRIEKPFISIVCVDSQGMWQVEVGPQGVTREALHRGNMSLALELVQQVLGGDRSALAKAFEVQELKAPKGSWRLALRPHDSGLRQAIASMQVEGGRHVEKVEYEEANGDVTWLSFSSLREAQAVDKADAGAWGE